MVRKSVRPNIKVHKLYMKTSGWIGKTVGVQLKTEHALRLCRAVLQGIENSPTGLIDLTLYPRVKTPVFTVTWLEK